MSVPGGLRKRRQYREAHHPDFQDSVRRYRKAYRWKNVQLPFFNYWALRRVAAQAHASKRAEVFVAGLFLRKAARDFLDGEFNSAVFSSVRLAAEEIRPFDRDLSARVSAALTPMQKAKNVFARAGASVGHAEIQSQIQVADRMFGTACDERDTERAKEWGGRLLALTAEEGNMPIYTVDDAAVVLEALAKRSQGWSNYREARRFRRALSFIRELYLRPALRADTDRMRSAVALAVSVDEEISADCEADLAKAIEWAAAAETYPPKWM